MNIENPFASINCHKLDFEFEVPADKFKSKEFLVRMKRPTGSVVCNTSQQASDYHVHFRWRVEEDEVRLFVVYYSGSTPIENGEREPYAETVMQWLGQFFQNENAFAEVGGAFGFKLDVLKSRFPLPMKLGAFADVETEIDGVSFKLPSKPNGISGMLLMENEGELGVQVRGGTRVVFNEFSPVTHGNEIMEVIGKLTERPRK